MTMDILNPEEKKLYSDEIEEYACRQSAPEPPALTEAWRRSNLRLVGGRMCSGHLQGRLLKMLVEISGANRILELGTFCGYSAACLAEGLGPEGSVVTIEHHEELLPYIRETLHSSGMANRVEVLTGDALTLMAALPERDFDMVFIDADKRDYPKYYHEAKRLVKKGGLILADNTLWYGHVADPAYDSDPQTRGVREFNRLVASDPDAETVLLPLRDGLTLVRMVR